jgi:hypothetical protein
MAGRFAAVFPRLVASVLLLFFAGCGGPTYQSYRDVGLADLVAAHQVWSIDLPYESSEALRIERASSQELLVSDIQGALHLTRIPLATSGGPGGVVHAEVESVESVELLDTGPILAIGRPSWRGIKRVSVLDRSTLAVKSAHELSFTGKKTINIPGSRQIGNLVILYQSSLAIGTAEWSDTKYRYRVPYVSGASYDLHVLNLDRGTVRSLAQFDGAALDVIGSRLATAKADVLSESRRRTLGGSLSLSDVPTLDPVLVERYKKLFSDEDPKKRVIDDQVNVFGDFFVVDGGRTLVFSLRGENDAPEYYSLSLEQDDAPRWSNVSQLVERYPRELVATPRDARSRFQNRDLPIGGQRYRVDRLALFGDGIVVLGRLRVDGKSEFTDDPAAYAAERVVFGVRPALLGDDLERVWDGQAVATKLTIGTVLEDAVDGAVYFPDAAAADASRFAVRGVRGRDGQAIAGFPANFRIGPSEARGPGDVSIAGTAVDFDAKRLFIHDHETNRLVSADLQKVRLPVRP